MDQSANHDLLRGSQPGAADRVRDLLARTVQDHVSDERSHASALEKIRKHLEGLEWLVKEVRQHELSDLSGQLAAQTEGLLRQLAEARPDARASEGCCWRYWPGRQYRGDRWPRRRARLGRSANRSTLPSLR